MCQKKFLKFSFCFFKRYFLSFINLLISIIKFFLSTFFRIIADLEVSGNPPLLLIITADPLLAASKLVRPNGSSHLDGTIDILTFLRKFNIYLLFLKPSIFKLLCLK